MQESVWSSDKNILIKNVPNMYILNICRVWDIIFNIKIDSLVEFHFYGGCTDLEIVDSLINKHEQVGS